MKHTLKAAALATVLAVAPAQASEICDYVGYYVKIAAQARDLGASYRETVRTYNHGFDQRSGGFSHEDRDHRTFRALMDKYIHAVFEAPTMAPPDEESRAIGNCTKLIDRHAASRTVDDPEPGVAEE
jgi:hypothetical protein